jgi:CBS domain-containing protein
MSDNISLTGSSVSDFLTPAKLLDPKEALSKAIGFMRESSSYEAFVEEDSRTAIVTVRDILDTTEVAQTKIQNVMHYVPRLNKKNTVSEAALLMLEHRIRSLPVYNGQKIAGVINSLSIVKELMKGDISKIRSGNLMTPNPICADAGDKVSKARSVMIRRKIDQLPILKDGKLSSAITSANIVFNTLPSTDRIKIARQEVRGFNEPVEEFSEPDVVSNDIKDSPKLIFKNMINNASNYSVITNFDEVQGILTFRDFMKMIQPEKKEGSEMPMYIVGLPEDPYEAEAAKEKFSRIVRLFQRALPRLNEARAIIKAGKRKSARERFEVSVFVTSPTRKYSFTANGFELPDVFDEVESWAKGVIGRASQTKRRVRADPGAIVPQSPED